VTAFEPAPAPQGPAVRQLLEGLARTHANGGVLLARLRATTPPPGRWFTFTSFLDVDQDVHDLLGSAAARAALADLGLPDPWPHARPPRFEWTLDGPLTLDGELAGVLVRGGAYVRFDGTAAQAKALAVAAVDELLQDRFEDVLVWGTSDPWTPWFQGVAWDRTWLVVDRARGEVTVLCVTDTD
jgi:hypothetical protein